MPVTVAIDFDGCIAKYERWQGLGVFGDPVDGAQVELDRMKAAGINIIINTTRGEDIDKVQEWLVANTIPFDSINENLPGAPANVSNRKVLANVYIDDRAMNFGGRWQGMTERVLDFKPWYRHSGARQTMGMEVLGYRADQFAIAVPTGQLMLICANMVHMAGCTEPWVLDKVQAKDIYDEMRDPFTVNLAFNYSMLGFEFELLEVVEGSANPPHLLRSIGDGPIKGVPILSHIGFHVPDIHEAVKRFEDNGYKVYSLVETLEHSNCPNRYNYAFARTRDFLGFDCKLICRIRR